MAEHQIIVESPQGWKDYEMLDSGDGYKLERFGSYVLARPEPKALWSKSLPESEWERLAHTQFIPGAGFGKQGKEDSGTWEHIKKMPDQWAIEYSDKDRLASEWSEKRHGLEVPDSFSESGGLCGLHLKLRLGLTAFKHVGVFPEQAPNWDWIYEHTKTLVNKAAVNQMNTKSVGNNEGGIKVLNLFAYTGAASLAARAAGAEVTHLDSVKQVVTWAKENMELSNLDNIRWIIDDALKFVRREGRRGNLYNGLILDPPAYGHGPEGERWKLDELIFDMLSECAKIVAPQNAFVILNLYSNGYSALLANTLLKKAFNERGDFNCGELVLTDKFEKIIPLSVYSRMTR
ncbi:MAG: class I SAM-dependent methyltransferase [Bacteroidales bacterium]